MTTAAAVQAQNSLSRQVGRLLPLCVVALVAGLSIVHIAYMLTMVHGSDVDAYWGAAMRLREGSTLYPAFAHEDANEVYRYAPWFAWLWVPLTYLPRGIVTVAWTCLLVAASALALLPLWGRTPARLALLALLGAQLVIVSLYGNVHALVLAPLVWFIDRRSGPLWIAIATSLKAAPLLLVLAYVGRRQWGRAALTIGLTALLLAPMLLYDLTNYTTNPGYNWGLFALSPALWLAALALAAGTAVAVARSQYGWLGSGVATVAAFPRLLGYDMTFLLVGLGDQPRKEFATAETGADSAFGHEGDGEA